MHSVLTLLSRLSAAAAALVLLPQLLSQVLETWGWQLALKQEGVRFLPLLRVRVATEAPAACLPAGVLLAESLKLPLLGRHCGLPAASAAAAILVRKYLLLVSQGLYILLAAVLGYTSLELASTHVLGFNGLPGLLVSCGLAISGAGIGFRLLLSRGAIALKLQHALRSLPAPSVTRALDRHAQAFGDADRRLRFFFSLPLASELRLVGCFLGAWLCEACETYLILQLLGVEMSFWSVASFEVGLSLLRNLVFLVPAGLGVQDAGYVLFLAALGAPEPAATGTAFVLLKRSKELIWAGVGFGLLALELPRRRAPGPLAESPGALML